MDKHATGLMSKLGASASALALALAWGGGGRTACVREIGGYIRGMKLIAEIIYGENRASWHYNVARLNRKYYLVLGIRDFDRGLFLGFEIDRTRIDHTRTCGYPRYGLPVEPARLEAVTISEAAMFPVRLGVLRGEGSGQRREGYFVLQLDDGLFLWKQVLDDTGHFRGHRIEAEKILPSQDSQFTHLYAEALDPEVEFQEKIPPEAMIDRLSVQDLSEILSDAVLT